MMNPEIHAGAVPEEGPEVPRQRPVPGILVDFVEDLVGVEDGGQGPVVVIAQAAEDSAPFRTAVSWP